MLSNFGRAIFNDLFKLQLGSCVKIIPYIFQRKKQTDPAHPADGLNQRKELGQRLIPPGEKSTIQVDTSGFIRTEEAP